MNCFAARWGGGGGPGGGGPNKMHQEENYKIINIS